MSRHKWFGDWGERETSTPNAPGRFAPSAGTVPRFYSREPAPLICRETQTRVGWGQQSPQENLPDLSGGEVNNPSEADSPRSGRARTNRYSWNCSSLSISSLDAKGHVEMNKQSIRKCEQIRTSRDAILPGVESNPTAPALRGTAWHNGILNREDRIEKTSWHRKRGGYLPSSFCRASSDASRLAFTIFRVQSFVTQLLCRKTVHHRLASAWLACIHTSSFLFALPISAPVQ